MNKTFTDLHDQALTMGEHIEQIGEAYGALERERDALAAKLERALSFSDAAKHYLADIQHGVARSASIEAVLIHELEAILFEAPTQSLNHITEQHGCSEQALSERKAQIAERQCSELAAQVEEETISRYEEWEESVNGWNFYPFPYKYAKQADNPNDCQCIVDGKPLNQCNERPR